MKKATKRIIVILIGILCLAVAVWAAPKLYRAWQAERIEQAKVEAELAREEELRQAQVEYPFLDDVVIKCYQGKEYYVSKGRYKGVHDIQSAGFEDYHVMLPDGTEERYKRRGGFERVRYVRPDGTLGNITERLPVWKKQIFHPQQLEEINTLEVMDYEAYVDFCKEWTLTQMYSDPNMNYIVRSFYTTAGYTDTILSGVRYEDSTAFLYIVENYTTSVVNSEAIIYTIPTDQDVDTVEVVQIYTEEEYENILKFGEPYDPYNISF